MATTAEPPMAEIAASFTASEQVYIMMQTPLFAQFCRDVVDDPVTLEVAQYAMEGARPSHLFFAVHYLLLKDPSDPLAQWFATLTDNPRPPEGCGDDLRRFIRENRAEIIDILKTRTVQTTYAERCRALLAPMCEVARSAGQPLNLIELGCSAAVLLVFDKFAYRLNDQGLIGNADAPLTLNGELRNGPDLFIPTIGKRTGIDLNIIDASDEDERRWLMALCFPELRDEQQRLATALEVLADTDITMLEGDGLTHLETALADTPDPVCVYHSACLFYWPREAQQRLEDALLQASQQREIWRIAIEPSDEFDDWHKGKTAAADDEPEQRGPSGVIVISHYANGKVTRRPAGRPSSDYGTIDWID